MALSTDRGLNPGQWISREFVPTGIEDHRLIRVFCGKIAAKRL
jgi:hypothetical protein